MATTKSQKNRTERVSVESALAQAAKKLSSYRALRKGRILLRALGPGGGDHYLTCSDGGVQLEIGAKLHATATSTDSLPVFEIIGDARRIHSLLTAKRDARVQFLAGGFRIRGDLRYASDLAMELGILKDPL
jgi:hypothetical protein